MKHDLPCVHFGYGEAPLPNWRMCIMDETPDDDAELPETPKDVTMMLGFDPLQYVDDPVQKFATDAEDAACAADVLTVLQEMRDEVLSQSDLWVPATKLQKDAPAPTLASAKSLTIVANHTGTIAVAAGKAAAKKLVPKADSAIFDVVDDKAINYARTRAANLVTQVSDTTRNNLRNTISDSITNGQSNAQLRDQISDMYDFSNARALMIARTEMAFAYNGGAYVGYQAAKDHYNLTMTKEWLLGDNACEICQENAAEGPIDFDDTFPSGDLTSPAHPNCRCSLSVHTANKGFTADSGEDDE